MKCWWRWRHCFVQYCAAFNNGLIRVKWTCMKPQHWSESGFGQKRPIQNSKALQTGKSFKTKKIKLNQSSSFLVSFKENILCLMTVVSPPTFTGVPPRQGFGLLPDYLNLYLSHLQNMSPCVQRVVCICSWWTWFHVASLFSSWLSVLAIFRGGAALSPSAWSGSRFLPAFCWHRGPIYIKPPAHYYYGLMTRANVTIKL